MEPELPVNGAGHVPLTSRFPRTSGPHTKDCPQREQSGYTSPVFLLGIIKDLFLAVLCHTERRRRPYLLRVGFCIVAVAPKRSFTPT